jgi:hypothetical protein
MLAGGPGLVNFGEDTRPPDTDTAVWVSADGASWRGLAVDGQLRPDAGQSGVAALGRRIIGVGDRRDQAGAESDIAIWIGTIQ